MWLNGVIRAMSRNDSVRRSGSKRRFLLPLIIATMMLLVVGVATASATSNIEGVWSFNGGDIAVQPAGGGTFKGTVVTETKFAECGHPVGQVIWTKMTPQSDGSYWGFHQWYFEKALCTLNPTLGPTAWRVIESAKGTRYLRVCLSNPGSSQPTIASNGSNTTTTYGCVSSAPATVGTASFNLVSLPSAKKCLSLRRFQIHIRDPRNDAFKTVSVTLRHRKIKVVRRDKYFVASINLKGLPLGTFTVKIRGTTLLGHHLTGRRTYHTCAKRRLHSSKKAHAKKH